MWFFWHTHIARGQIGAREKRAFFKVYHASNRSCYVK